MYEKNLKIVFVSVCVSVKGRQPAHFQITLTPLNTQWSSFPHLDAKTPGHEYKQTHQHRETNNAHHTKMTNKFSHTNTQTQTKSRATARCTDTNLHQHRHTKTHRHGQHPHKHKDTDPDNIDTNTKTQKRPYTWIQYDAGGGACGPASP